MPKMQDTAEEHKAGQADCFDEGSSRKSPALNVAAQEGGKGSDG